MHQPASPESATRDRYAAAALAAEKALCCPVRSKLDLFLKSGRLTAITHTVTGARKLS